MATTTIDRARLGSRRRGSCAPTLDEAPRPEVGDDRMPDDLTLEVTG